MNSFEELVQELTKRYEKYHLEYVTNKNFGFYINARNEEGVPESTCLIVDNSVHISNHPDHRFDKVTNFEHGLDEGVERACWLLQEATTQFLIYLRDN
jgi:hypothetical protein